MQTLKENGATEVGQTIRGRLKQEHNIEHRQVYPKNYPDLDLRQYYGLPLTYQKCFRNEPLKENWRQCCDNPASL